MRGVGGVDVAVQPMVDSGASGLGFVDPGFVRRAGISIQPTSRRITLADGSVVSATGEATLTYTLAARSCRGKDSTPPVRFTSTFVVTPLAPYELILGMGWLEQHDVRIGFRERSLPTARRRRRQAALHPAAGALQRGRQRGG